MHRQPQNYDRPNRCLLKSLTNFMPIMKNLRHASLIASAVALAAAASSAPAFASDGTISFNGSITSSTCVVSAGSANLNVTLPNVSATTLSTVGATSGRTAFSIAVTACQTGGGVHTFFEAGPTTDLTTGNLSLNGGSTAAGVEIQLTNADGILISTKAADGAQGSEAVNVDAAGAATLNYGAQYISTGAVTAGSAKSSVTYSIIYQ
jgi:major type 1 subunit fimbrin (pilin)